MKKVKLAFIGGGFIGQLCHIKNYSLDRRCEIVAIAEPKVNQCKLIAKKYSIPFTFSNHLDLLKSNIKFDAVVVVVNRLLVAKITYDCLRANKNVFTEKPIALNFEDAKKLTHEAKKKKLLFKVGFNKIYDEGVQAGASEIKKLLKSKELGELIYVRVHRFSGTGYKNHSGNIQTKETFSEDVSSKYKFNKIPPGINKHLYKGYLEYMNINSHLLSFLSFVLESEPKIDYVSFSKKFVSLLILDYKKNFKITIETKHYKDHHWDEEFVFYFEQGSVSIKTPPQQLENVSAKVTILKRNSKKSVSILNQNPSWSFRNQAYDFVNDIINKKVLINDATKSLNGIRLIENVWKNLSQ